MTMTNEAGDRLAASVDWSDFGPVFQTIRCRCEATFRSHHKLVLHEGRLQGVSQWPCPSCGTQTEFRGTSSDSESWTLRS